MKKIILFFALISVVMLSAAENSEKQTADKNNAVVSASRLNVRMKPTIKSPKAGTLVKGERVQVTGKNGAWIELAAPQSLKLYVSEVYLINGKLTNDTNLRAGRSASAPSFGVLPAGTALKAVGTSDKYGWIQVTPPENIRVYAYGDYITIDSTIAIEEKAAAKTGTAAPAANTVVPAAAPATTDTDAEIKKAPAVPVQEEKTPVKPETAEKKSDAPEVPALPAPVKEDKAIPAEVAKAEKTAVKEVKTAASEINKKLAADLAALGAASSGEKITVSGKLYRIPASSSPVSDYAVFKDSKNQGYVCGKDAKFFEDNVGKELSLSGKSYKIKGWKSVIVVLD